MIQLGNRGVIHFVHYTLRYLREKGRVPISEAHCTTVTSLCGDTVSAWLRHGGHEGAALDGVSPALRAWASDFSLRGQRKVTKRKATPTCSPSCVGFPRFTRLSDGTRRWAIPGPAPLARRPASRPGQTCSPRRTTGGQNPTPSPEVG